MTILLRRITTCAYNYL